MTDADRLAIQREAAASQHIVLPALELAQSSPTFRRAVVAIEREKTKPLRCMFCLELNCPGHDFGGKSE